MARVLVITDCPDFLGRVRCAMKRDRHEVLEAWDALAGMQRAVEDTPDWIVVAESLGGLGAEYVFARLAAEPATRAVPVRRVADEGMFDEWVLQIELLQGLASMQA